MTETTTPRRTTRQAISEFSLKLDVGKAIFAQLVERLGGHLTEQKMRPREVLITRRLVVTNEPDHSNGQ